MHNIRTYSRKVMQPPYRLPLKVTSGLDGSRVMDPFDWTMDKMSTRDGNFCHTRLDSPLKLWNETLRRPRSPICTIGLMVKAFPKLKEEKQQDPHQQSDYDEIENKTGKYSLDK